MLPHQITAMAHITSILQMLGSRKSQGILDCLICLMLVAILKPMEKRAWITLSIYPEKMCRTPQETYLHLGAAVSVDQSRTINLGTV